MRETVPAALLLSVLVVAMHLSKVLVFKSIKNVLEEAVESDDGLVGEFRQVQDEGVVISHGAGVKTRQQPMTEIAAPLESAIELVMWRELRANCARQRFDCRSRCRDVIGTHRGTEGGLRSEEHTSELQSPI